MKPLVHTIRLVALLLLGGVCTSCITPLKPRETVPSELVESSFLAEVTRYIYRWYADESDMVNVLSQKNMTFWVRRYEFPLDAGDKSQWAEMVIPDFGVSLKLKKAHYSIPELKTMVTNATFKIVTVGRIEKAPHFSAGYTRVAIATDTIKRDLFRTRHTVDFPDENMTRHLRMAVRNELLKTLHEQKGDLSTITWPQAIHVAPVSPVSNDIWVYWETYRLLIRYSSDMDFSNPALWNNEEMAVKIYTIADQVVVSFGEVPGSNAYLTRDQVGRILYNCIILGKRVQLQPVEQFPDSAK